MANKIRISKFVTPARPLNRPASQRSAAKPAALYLLALRSHLAQTQPIVPRPKLKQTIPIEAAEQSDGVPEPVKITHS